MEVKIIDNVVHVYYNGKLIASCKKELARNEFHWQIDSTNVAWCHEIPIRATCAELWRQWSFVEQVITDKLIP